MQYLERRDSVFKSLIKALLQIIRLLNEEEISLFMASNMKAMLDDYLVRANFVSYVKRNTMKMEFHSTSWLSIIIDIICGKKYDNTMGIGCRDEVFEQMIVLHRRKIEKFINKKKWKNISIFNLLKSDVDYIFGPSIIVLVDQGAFVFENSEELSAAYPQGYARPKEFFRLCEKDDELVILFASDRGSGLHFDTIHDSVNEKKMAIF